MDQQNELNLGEYLKKAREMSNFSIEKFSLKTKINANILRHLENEDYSSLPSPAYLKGFVLSYVKMFSLNEAEVIQKLHESYSAKTGTPYPSLTLTTKHQVKTPHTKKDEPDDVINNSENIIDTTKSFVPYVLGIILIAVSIGGYQVISKMIKKEASVYNESDSHAETSTLEEAVMETPPVVSQATPEVKVEVKPETPPAPKVEKKVEVKVSKDGKRNFPSIDFHPIPTKLYSLVKDAPENQDDNLMPRSYKAKLDTDLQNLYIHAVDGETWLSYKVDDEAIQNEFIRQGKALFLQGSTIRMFFGNVNVTKIFLNNNLIDPQSKNGLKSIVFPQERASRFQRPLFPHSTAGEIFTSEEYIEKMKEEESLMSKP